MGNVARRRIGPSAGAAGRRRSRPRAAFVLSGAASLGALRVGALRALHECGIEPALLVRTRLSPRTVEFHRHKVLQMPNQIPLIVEHRIVAFSLGHPGLGPRRIAAMLARAEWGALGVSPNRAGASGPWCSCSPPGVGDRVTPSHQFFWV